MQHNEEATYRQNPLVAFKKHLNIILFIFNSDLIFHYQPSMFLILDLLYAAPHSHFLCCTDYFLHTVKNGNTRTQPASCAVHRVFASKDPCSVLRLNMRSSALSNAVSPITQALHSTPLILLNCSTSWVSLWTSSYMDKPRFYIQHVPCSMPRTRWLMHQSCAGGSILSHQPSVPSVPFRVSLVRHQRACAGGATRT